MKEMSEEGKVDCRLSEGCTDWREEAGEKWQ